MNTIVRARIDYTVQAIEEVVRNLPGCMHVSVTYNEVTGLFDVRGISASIWVSKYIINKNETMTIFDIDYWASMTSHHLTMRWPNNYKRFYLNNLEDHNAFVASLADWLENGSNQLYVQKDFTK